VLFVTEKKPNQPDHAACVRTIAEELTRDNWTVKANIEGYDKPAAIGQNLLPDIQADKKGCLRRICEIATPEMFNGDMSKYREVKNYCHEYDFRMYIIDKDGKRREIDPDTFGKNQNAKV
jgi:hypothetical protein